MRLSEISALALGGVINGIVGEGMGLLFGAVLEMFNKGSAPTNKLMVGGIIGALATGLGGSKLELEAKELAILMAVGFAFGLGIGSIYESQHPKRITSGEDEVLRKIEQAGENRRAASLLGNRITAATYGFIMGAMLSLNPDQKLKFSHMINSTRVLSTAMTGGTIGFFSSMVASEIKAPIVNRIYGMRG